MTDKHKIHINMDRIHEIALRGVRRTYVFLGLGLNAARRPDFREFHLESRMNLKLMPEEVTDANIDEFKDNFAVWVTSNGLRELVETFSVFLSEIYRVCLILDVVSGKFAAADLPKLKDQFDYNGIARQLDELRVGYDVSCDFSDHIQSLVRLRNCYTHRLGVVSSKDIGVDDLMVVKWRGMEIIIEQEEGDPIVIDGDFDEGIYVEKGGKIGVRVVDKIREFHTGEFAILDQNELKEICWTVLLASGSVKDSTIELFQRRETLFSDASG